MKILKIYCVLCTILTVNMSLVAQENKKEELLDYANNSENGLPFVPWYLVKVKRVNSTQQRI